MNKFFFMALISGNLEGKPLVQFNSLTAMNTRNITARDLNKIQDAAADMLTNDGVPFDNIVIHNVFFLAEATEEEFFAGTAIPPKTGEAAQEASDFVAAPEGDGLEAVQAAVAESLAVEEAPQVVDTADYRGDGDQDNAADLINEERGAVTEPFAEDDTTNR